MEKAPLELGARMLIDKLISGCTVAYERARISPSQLKPACQLRNLAVSFSLRDRAFPRSVPFTFLPLKPHAHFYPPPYLASA